MCVDPNSRWYCNVFTEKVSQRKARLMLLQDGDDLLFGKPTTRHVLVLKLGKNKLQAGFNRGGRSNPRLIRLHMLKNPLIDKRLEI